MFLKAALEVYLMKVVKVRENVQVLCLRSVMLTCEMSHHGCKVLLYLTVT